MEIVDMEFELTHPDAVVPYRGRNGDAGLDVFPAFDYDYMEIPPGETKLIPTGLKSAFPEGFGVLLQERGSIGSKGIALRAGVVDANYRGEWFVALQNNNDKPVLIAKYPEDFPEDEAIILEYGNAIAQAVVIPVFDVQASVTDNINKYESERGEDCLGSSN